LIRNTTPINVQKDYEPNIEKEDAKNVEEKSESEEEFEQKAN
jgi:flagellar assembly factor FliW